MLRSILQWFIISVIVTLVIYIGFVFIANGLNPFKWLEVYRQNFGGLTIVCNLIVGVGVFVNYLSNKD